VVVDWWVKAVEDARSWKRPPDPVVPGLFDHTLGISPSGRQRSQDASYRAKGRRRSSDVINSKAGIIH